MKTMQHFIIMQHLYLIIQQYYKSVPTLENFFIIIVVI